MKKTKSTNAGGGMEKPSELWSEIENEFFIYETIIDGWSLPSDQEIRKLKAALKTKRKLVNFNLEGLFMMPSLKSASKLPPVSNSVLREMYPTFRILNIDLPVDVESKLSRHLIPEVNLKTRSIIRESLSTRTVSLEFVSAWGTYREAVIKFMIFLNRKDVEDYYKRNILKNLPRVVEKHIYAYFLHQHWIKGQKTRKEAENDLAEIIATELERKDLGRVELRALKNMCPKGEIGLKGTYASMPKTEILQIVEEKIIAANLLKILK